MHAGVFDDIERFAVVIRHAADNADGELAEFSRRGVDQLKFIVGCTDSLQHRRRGFRRGRPHHRVNHRFGVFNQVERSPGGLDSLTGDFHQWSGEKIAKLLNEADERFTGGISH